MHNNIQNKKVYNFGAGPSVLPPEVYNEASSAVKEYKNSGMSILEISHRSDLFEEIILETTSLLRSLMKIPNDYYILFLQGGGSQQFAMIPMNLLAVDETAYYIDSGVWAKRAQEESSKIGRSIILASSSSDNYNYIPKDYRIPDDASYLHITTNNTIYGTQWLNVPKTSIPLIADASSDILSKEINITDYGLLYAGAQKNLGPAGVTLVIIKKDIIGKSKRILPKIFDYNEHVNAKSLYNTPPVFAIYVMLLNLRWLQKSGGVTYIEKLNFSKADLLYRELDSNPLFIGHSVKEDRSIMNITFRITQPGLEKTFLETTTKHGIAGIKGYRSVGGFRVSTYNAVPIENIQYLVEIMKEFSAKFG